MSSQSQFPTNTTTIRVETESPSPPCIDGTGNMNIIFKKEGYTSGFIHINSLSFKEFIILEFFETNINELERLLFISCLDYNIKQVENSWSTATSKQALVVCSNKKELEKLLQILRIVWKNLDEINYDKDFYDLLFNK